jgi:hypothetical protein
MKPIMCAAPPADAGTVIPGLPLRGIRNDAVYNSNFKDAPPEDCTPHAAAIDKSTRFADAPGRGRAGIGPLLPTWAVLQRSGLTASGQ